jgi:hypothetical protein
MTKAKKIVKGDKFVCLLPRLGSPLVGAVISLTADETKQIGLEFDQHVNGHSCDGRGKEGHCLWTRPAFLLTIEEYEQQLKAKLAAADNVGANDLDELVLE